MSGSVSDWGWMGLGGVRRVVWWNGWSTYVSYVFRGGVVWLRHGTAQHSTVQHSMGDVCTGPSPLEILVWMYY